MCVIVAVEKVISPHISPVNIKGEAIDIDYRIMKQQYTTLFPFNGSWVVERPCQQKSSLGSGCVAQLVERLLPIPEVRGSNPVIGKNLY